MLQYFWTGIGKLLDLIGLSFVSVNLLLNIKVFFCFVSYFLLSRRVAEGSHEWDEQSRWASLSQKRVVQQLKGSGTLRRISHEHPV